METTAATHRPDVDLPAGFARPEPAGNRDGVAVVHAVEPASGRRVTLRILTAPIIPSRREAFEREAAALLDFGGHPHVQTLYRRAVTAGGQPALVLERCTTASPRPQPSRLGGALSAAIKLSGAVETLHVGGLLHCDIAPRHVLWTAGGEPVLAAFGASTRPTTAHAPVTLHRFSAHTAPELLLGQVPSAATDVYGLAATLYQLVTGHPPFPEYDGESAAALSLRIVRGGAVPLGPGVPLELSDLIAWALAPDPGDRPPSAVWLGEELGNVERRLGQRRTRMTIGIAPRPPRRGAQPA